MKTHILTLTFALLFANCGFCQIPANDDIIRQKLNFQSKDTTADDYLLTLGEKSNFNILAETTNLPTEADITRVNDDTLYALMFQFSNTYGLAWHRLDKTTLIFAPDAGIDEITRLLGEHQAFPLDALNPSNQANIGAIMDYALPLLAQKQKAGKKPEITVNFANLPADLKTRVISWEIGEPIGFAFSMGVMQMLTDDFWQRVRLRKRPDLQSNNVFLEEDILLPQGLAHALWEIPGPGAQIHLLPQQPNDVNLPSPRAVQKKDFEPLWKSWQRASWEKQLSNAKLDFKCQLDSKRVPLKTVLEQVSKQCGVPLEAAKPHSEKLLTLRVRDLKARDILGALSRMTGGTWQSKEQGYLLQGAASPMQRALFPSDDFDRNRYRNRTDFYKESQKYLTSLRDAISREAGARLNTPEGVAWADLSEELRNEVRAEISAKVGEFILRMQGSIQPLLDGSMQVSVHPLTEGDLQTYPFTDLQSLVKKGDLKIVLASLKNDGTVLKSESLPFKKWQKAGK